MSTHQRCSYSFSALQHMYHGSTPAPPSRACATHHHGSFSSTWPPLRAGPAGWLTTLHAPGPAATWPRVTVVTPSASPPTSAQSCPRHQAHGTVPRSRSPRTSPQDHVPVRCLVSVMMHRSRPLLTPGGHVPTWSPVPITAQRSRLPIARLVVTFPSVLTNPGHVPNQ